MNWHKWVFPAAIIVSAGVVQAAEDMVTLNFVDADIDSVVKAIGKITQKNFVIDPRVKGKVNIISGKPVSPALTYQILLSALRLQGFTAVESKGVTLVLPEADAKQHGVPVDLKGSGTRGNQLTTEVFALKYESAAQLIPVIRPLVAANNPVTTFPGSNAIVVTDYADNLRRIAQIVESIDQPPSSDAIVLPVQNMMATELAGVLTKMLGEGSQSDASQKVTVTADPRTNSLLIRSSNPAKIAQTRALAARLDVAQDAPGNVHVVYLKNADAVRLAQTLRSIVTGEAGNALASAGTQSAFTSVSAAPNASGQPGAATSALGASTFGAPAGSNFGSASNFAGNQTGGGMIQADPATNSLVITAPDAVFNNLRAVIDKLDARRAQVHIEALIAEVSSDKLTELGIQWQGVGNVGGAGVYAGTSFATGGNNIVGLTASGLSAQGVVGSAGSSSSGVSLPTNGLNIGVLNRVNVLGRQVLNISALAHAIQTDGVSNVLSTPNLLTLDNEEARIVVGQNVPFITGQYAQTAGAVTATPFQTIERKDVGISLKVKPQITEGGTVRLQVSQEVSSVDTSQSNASGIITNKRALDSTVLLADGQTIVLGGLIQDSVNDGTEKVPVLGDIPVVGALFSYMKKRRTKTNLMIFLKPTIVRDANMPVQLTADRYSYVIGEQGKNREVTTDLPAFAPRPNLPAENGVPAEKQ